MCRMRMGENLSHKAPHSGNARNRGSDSTKNARPAQEALLVVWNTTNGTMNSRI
ncbi:hypothetical protein D3C80_1807390 [compost metagenome]